MENLLTPFSDYRHESITEKFENYFIQPEYFDKLISRQPTIIEGARGSGKTTLLRALDNFNEQLSKEYLGIYFRIDIALTSSFKGKALNDDEWGKLFAHYFVVSLCYELSKLVILISSKIKINEQSIIAFFENYFFQEKFSSLQDISKYLFKLKNEVSIFLNNQGRVQCPIICNYAEIIKEYPKCILNSSEKLNNKTIYFLIDEFENYTSEQQRCVLTLVKYYDRFHTFKICSRPWGISSFETSGGEFIQKTDDISYIDLSNIIDGKRDEFQKFALEICNKRLQLYYERLNLNYDANYGINKLLESVSIDEELSRLISEKEYQNLIKLYIDEVESNEDKDLIRSFYDNPIDFCVYKLQKDREEKSPLDCIKLRNDTYRDYINNNKDAFVYLYASKNNKKVFAGFNNLVNLSGGTIRYLLEFCNEIFAMAKNNKDFDYKNPTIIDSNIQTEAVLAVSESRIHQIKAIPYLGYVLRRFVFAIGQIFSNYHKRIRISKIEPNHFSLKDTYDAGGFVEQRLRECVKRGILIVERNNKKPVKALLVDEYSYKLHPLYSPFFGISWRQKHKLEFTKKQLEILLGENTEDIRKVINGFSPQKEKNQTKNGQVDMFNFFDLMSKTEEE